MKELLTDIVMIHKKDEKIGSTLGSLMKRKKLLTRPVSFRVINSTHTTAKLFVKKGYRQVINVVPLKNRAALPTLKG